MASVRMVWKFSCWFAFCSALLCAGAPVFAEPARLAMAVIGDSDSHGFHDTLTFKPGSPDRGGAFRNTTFQWTEVLDRLRSSEIDLGPRRPNGGAPRRFSQVASWFGIELRRSKKLDNFYNFAYTGSTCNDLWKGDRQVPRLLDLMGTAPGPWERAVVVIRIGVNSFGTSKELELLSHDPQSPAVRAVIDQCVTDVTTAASAIRRSHPGTRVVLVGIFDNVHWSQYLNRWQSPQALANIHAGLEPFNAGLRRAVAADSGMAFFDDQAWFAGIWGGRGPDGRPAYHPLVLGNGLQVTNTSGDHPSNAALADGHGSTAWNAKWAQAMLALLNDAFKLGLTPIREDEVGQLVAPGGRWPAPSAVSSKAR